MDALGNNSGITIKQLKELVKDLPEVDSNGNDYGLWVENTDNEHFSNSAKLLIQLNEGDLLVSIRDNNY